MSKEEDSGKMISWDTVNFPVAEPTEVEAERLAHIVEELEKIEVARLIIKTNAKGTLKNIRQSLDPDEE